MRSRWIFGANKFGERGGHRHRQRLLGRRSAHRPRPRSAWRAGRLLGHHIGAVEAEAVGQDQPAFDAALLLAEPVMIVDAADPFAAQFAVVGARHQRGVLARHGVLIAIAVERPGLHLALVHLAAMQHLDGKYACRDSARRRPRGSRLRIPRASTTHPSRRGHSSSRIVDFMRQDLSSSSRAIT